MAREVDARSQHAEQTNAEGEKGAAEKSATAARAQGALRALASEVSDRMPGTHRVRIESFDEHSGAPRRLRSDAAPAERGNWVARAHAHLVAVAPALGLAETQSPEYLPNPHVLRAADGGREVALGQRHLGLPVFECERRVRFAADGRILETRGTSVALPADLEAAPELDAAAAVARAARHLTDDDEATATPTVATVLDDLPERPTLFAPGPFTAPPRAQLAWLPLGGSARLAWEVLLAPAGGETAYRLLVDAGGGEILYCRPASGDSRDRTEPETFEAAADSAADPAFSSRARPNLSIPGRDTAGVVSTLRVDREGATRRIEAAVEIRHAFAGDLRVTLVTPSGRRAGLRRFGGGDGRDGVRAIWTSDNTLSLADLVGEPAAGDWSLEAADYVGADDGRLLSWALALEL